MVVLSLVSIFFFFNKCFLCHTGLPWWLSGKEPACQRQETRVRSLGWEDPLEKEMATHSSTLTWEIP